MEKLEMLNSARRVLLLLFILVLPFNCTATEHRKVSASKTHSKASPKKIKRPVSKKSVSNRREWTVMVYMAADNELEKPALCDINEMETVGSTNKVAVVVQVDRSRGHSSDDGNWGGARRFFITRDKNPCHISSRVLADLGSIDSGSKRSFLSFTNWAIKNFPAKKFLLIIWSHGTGWETELLYKANRRSAGSKDIPQISPEIQASVGYDEASRGAIDIHELRDSLEQVAHTMHHKIDVLGFDACLMQTVEVAFELRKAASFIAASEHSISVRGWPYANVIYTLACTPTITPGDFAKLIPTIQGRAYKGLSGKDETLTFSSIDTSNIPGLAKAVSQFGRVLSGKVATQRPVIAAIRDRVQTFSRSGYVDLFHFANLVRCTFNDKLIKSSAEKVLAYSVMTSSRKRATSLLLSRAINQAKVRNAYGLTIYFPRQRDQFLSQYSSLQWARNSGWKSFITAWLKDSSRVLGTRRPLSSRRQKNLEVSFAPILLDSLSEVVNSPKSDLLASDSAEERCLQVFEEALCQGDFEAIASVVQTLIQEDASRQEGEQNDRVKLNCIKPVLSQVRARLAFECSHQSKRDENDESAQTALKLIEEFLKK